MVEAIRDQGIDRAKLWRPANNASSVYKTSPPCMCGKMHVAHFDGTPQLLNLNYCKHKLMHSC